jgi:hypothetical protein
MQSRHANWFYTSFSSYDMLMSLITSVFCLSNNRDSSLLLLSSVASCASILALEWNVYFVVSSKMFMNICNLAPQAFFGNRI